MSGGESAESIATIRGGVWRAALLYAGFVALAILTRAVVLGLGILDLDEAVYSVVAREMLRGRQLYADVADHKPPLVFLFYALAEWLWGPAILGARLLAVLTVLPLTALALATFFDRTRVGVVAAVAWLVYGAAFIGHDMLAVNCEILMMAPLAWALVVLRRPADLLRARRLLLAGLLIGVAVLFKYQAGLWLPVGLVAIFHSHPPHCPGRRWQALAALGIGFATPLVGTWAAFAVMGLGPQFIYWNLANNFGYVSASVTGIAALARAAGSIVPFLAVTAPLWVGAVRLRASSMDAHRRALILSSLTLAGLGVLPGWRFYPHYLIPLYVPLALAAAPWLADRLSWPLTRRASLVIAWPVSMLVGFSVSTVVLFYRTDVYSETRPVFSAVANEIRARACRPLGALFVWGYAPQFYYETDLPVASRFLLVDRTLVGHVSGGQADPRLIEEEHWNWLMADLTRNAPDFIVDASAARLSRWSYRLADFPRLDRYVREGYRPVVSIGGAVLWQRQTCLANTR